MTACVADITVVTRSLTVAGKLRDEKKLWDILLVINSNLGLISHCCWDKATYWLKIAHSSYPAAALWRGRHNQIYIVLQKVTYSDFCSASVYIMNVLFNTCAFFRITVCSLCAWFAPEWHFWWRHKLIRGVANFFKLLVKTLKLTIRMIHPENYKIIPKICSKRPAMICWHRTRCMAAISVPNFVCGRNSRSLLSVTQSFLA